MRNYQNQYSEENKESYSTMPIHNLIHQSLNANQSLNKNNLIYRDPLYYHSNEYQYNVLTPRIISSSCPNFSNVYNSKYDESNLTNLNTASYRNFYNSQNSNNIKCNSN